MVNYSVDEQGIFHVNFLEIVEYLDIVKWLAEFSEITPASPYLYMIYDISNVDLRLDSFKLLSLARRADEATYAYDRVRTAFIMNKGTLRTYMFLLSFLRSGKKTIRKSFTNYTSAKQWLLKEKEKDLVKTKSYQSSL